MAIKLQIFTIKKLYFSIAVISLNPALKKDENCYLQVLLKECKYIDKKVIRHIDDSLSDFPSSDGSDKE